MHGWSSYVFVRLCFWLIAGILAGYYFPRPPLTILASALGIAVVTYLFFWYRRLKNPERMNPGWIAACLLFSFGWTNVILQDPTDAPHHLIQRADFEAYECIVVEPPSPREKSVAVDVIMTRGLADNTWLASSGKVRLYLPSQTAVKYGDVLLIKGKPERIQPPTNPHQFDFSAYASRSYIYHQHFVREFRIVGNRKPSLSMAAAIDARHWAEEKLDRFIDDPNAASVATALILGITVEIDRDILIDYMRSGTIHVLSVSGLHISIIYLIVITLMRPLSRLGLVKTGFVVSILFLWAYALISGLSPCVLRAVLMFTIVVIGKLLNRESNIYNSLGLAACILLVANPMMLFNIGFQLSFVAVFSIVYFYRGIYRLLEPRWSLLDWAWKMSCVSIAAQLGTLPVTLFYFHQFPNYFLLANLVVIPIASVVLIGGLILLLTSSVPFIPVLLGWLLKVSIAFMNTFAAWISQLPGSVTKHLHLTIFECILLAGIIAFISLLLDRRKLTYMIAAASVLAIFTLSAFLNTRHRPQWVVYQLRGAYAMDFSARGGWYEVRDRSLHERAHKFATAANRTARSLSQLKDCAVISRAIPGAKLYDWDGKIILHIFERGVRIPAGFRADFLVVSHNAIDNPRDFPFERFGLVVLDDSNGYHWSEKLAQQHGIHIFSVRKKGAFVYPAQNSSI